MKLDSWKTWHEAEDQPAEYQQDRVGDLDLLARVASAATAASKMRIASISGKVDGSFLER